jgi:cold shock protein
MNGTVKFFNVSKGFGFVKSDTGEEYFVHITGIAPGVTLRENDAVTFEVGEGDRGPKAINVALAK